MHRKPKLPVRQLIILSICRFAEPLVLTSVLPYLPEMIEGVGVPQSEVAKWVGIQSAVVSICQCIMGVPWGSLSDHVGRKPIVIFDLICTMIFSLIFGFSKSLGTLIITRGCLGLVNGNVGIMRTMVAETVRERELQPRAFSIMPLVWTIGSIFGPILGGSLANPAVKHPKLFGSSEFLKRNPFVLPNIVASVFFIIGIFTGILFLKETLESKKNQRDYGIILGKLLTSPCSGPRNRTVHGVNVRSDESSPLLQDDRPPNPDSNTEEAAITSQSQMKPKEGAPKKRSTWRDIFTPQSNLALLSYSTLALHSMAFDSLFPVFLHYKEQNLHGNPDVYLPIKFSGGFGYDSQTIGLLYTFTGVIGMVAQFLVFPIAARRYGILNCLRTASMGFPSLYFITPFTALVPTTYRKATVFLLMLFKLTCVIFSFPCCTILLTNSASSLSILGTLNGVSTSMGAIGRAAGPAAVGMAFTLGVKLGYIIVPWWTLGVLAIISAIPIFRLAETDAFIASNDHCDNANSEGELASEETSSIYGSIANHTDPIQSNASVDRIGSSPKTT